MTELEKFYAGEQFWMNDPEISKLKANARSKCNEFNRSDEDWQLRYEILKELFGKTEDDMFIKPPFYCDYGMNIRVGKNFFSNFETVMLDAAPITFGDNVLIGPQCGFYTAVHPMDAKERASGMMCGKPIMVGNDVWFGGGCRILPGITIGNDVVIGAGSVVTKDIPDHVIVAGNPARILKNKN